MQLGTRQRREARERRLLFSCPGPGRLILSLAELLKNLALTRFLIERRSSFWRIHFTHGVSRLQRFVHHR